MTNMEELAKTLSETVSKMQEEMTKRSNELSTADKEVNDLQHYIEFNDLSAAKGFAAYKELQTVLRNRRTVKNDMKIFSNIKTTVPNLEFIPNAYIGTTISTNNQQYAARVRTDLFPASENAELDLGALSAYKNCTFYAKSKKQNHCFHGIEEALDYILPVGTPMITRVNVAKRIIRAMMSNTKYAAYTWMTA